MIDLTTRTLCEIERPQSRKLEDFLKKKRLENGKYGHSTVEELRGVQTQIKSPKLIRRSSLSLSTGSSDYMPHAAERKRRSYFDERTVLVSSSRTKLSIKKGGPLLCAQDYYPSFLLADESRYEEHVQKRSAYRERKNTSTPQRPPCILSAMNLKQRIRDIYIKNYRVGGQYNVPIAGTLASQLAALPRAARGSTGRNHSNPRGRQYAY
jgi:hypothetical protein